MSIQNLIDSLDDAKVKLLLHLEERKHDLTDELYPVGAVSATFNVKNPIHITEDLKVVLFYLNDILPSYKATKDKDYGRNISRFFTLAIARQITNLNGFDDSKQYVLYVEQHFKHRYTRDLDNRNRKLLIDAIKYNHLLSDDNMKFLSIFECGKEGQPQNETLVFLVESDKFGEFYNHWNTTKSEAVQIEIEERKKALKEFEVFQSNSDKNEVDFV